MEEEKLDLLSNLPYEITRHIVSFLPLKQAVRTSILSTTWRSHWTPHCVNWDLNSAPIHEDGEDQVAKVMGNFLKSYNVPEQRKFCLGFHASEEDEYSLKEKDAELVVLATKGVGKELHLDFSKGKQRTSNFQLNLKLPTQTASLFSLKTVHLRSVTQLAESLVSSLFSNCCLLESLKLEKCNELQSIHIDANTSLQSLVVVDCPNIVSITVSAPNLKSFSYRGVAPNIELKNTSNLVDVMLNLRDGLGPKEFDCEDFLILLASIQEVQFLTISGWLLQYLCASGVIFSRLDFKFNKLKELRWIDSVMDKFRRDSLACFLNITPSLESLFVNIDQSLKTIPTPFFHFFWHEPHMWMNQNCVKSNAVQLQHLRVIKLAGFSTQDHDLLLLLDILLNTTLALKTLTVSSPDDKNSWHVVMIPRSQVKQIKRSNPEQIVVPCGQNQKYFYGFTEQNASCRYKTSQ